MNRHVAEQIVSAINEPSPPFNTLDALSKQIPDAAESHAFRLALGEVMGQTVALLKPALRRYPDLDPDRDR